MKEMNGEERFIAALRCEEVDRMPSHWLGIEPAGLFRKELNAFKKQHPFQLLDYEIFFLSGYEFTHALDAQGKEKDCSVCHQDRQFCNACHSEYQVYPHNHQQPGWAIPNVGGLHRTEAENDLESCISCHEQNAETVCQSCHQQ